MARASLLPLPHRHQGTRSIHLSIDLATGATYQRCDDHGCRIKKASGGWTYAKHLLPDRVPAHAMPHEEALRAFEEPGMHLLAVEILYNIQN